jgi:hypothetical protein
MTAAALAGVLGLALVDSTSFGTLILPIMMLIAPDVRRRNVVLYLCTIALFYFLVGIALLLGASAVLEAVGALVTTEAGSVVQAALGVLLVVLAFVVHPASVTWHRARRGQPPKPHGAWRRRALGAEATVGTVVAVALTAGLVEMASMLPYLVAVGILVATGVPWTTQIAVLAIYVVVMIAPALVLFGMRSLAGNRVEPHLRRIENWTNRLMGGAAAAWLLGILGLLLTVDSVTG